MNNMNSKENIMDTEKLLKLNELKDKGILTQEEFEAEKKKILSSLDTKEKKVEKNIPHKQPKKGINWSNVGISFLISSISSALVIYVTLSLYGQEDGMEISRVILGPVAGIIMCVLAFSVKSGKYKNYTHPIVIFVAVLLLGPLGIWLSLYEYLQIKQGNAVLKDASEK